LICASNVSNYKIAKDTGITEATIGNYKNRNTSPTLANANIIIDYFNKKKSELSNEAIIEKAIDCIRKSNLSDYKIAEGTKMSRMAIGNYRKGKNTPSIVSANTILNFFANIDRIEVEKSNVAINNPTEYEEAMEKGLKLLPEVDFKFSGGKAELLGSTDVIKRYWYLPDCKDCEAIAQVAGNSMAPAYPSGCWIALKRFSFEKEFPNQIPFGNVFGIVVEDKQTGDYHGHIKILRRYEDPAMAKRFWIARSIDRDNHDDFDIDIEQVRGLWIVKQHVVADVIL